MRNCSYKVGIFWALNIFRNSRRFNAVNIWISLGLHCKCSNIYYASMDSHIIIHFISVEDRLLPKLPFRLMFYTPTFWQELRVHSLNKMSSPEHNKLLKFFLILQLTYNLLSMQINFWGLLWSIFKGFLVFLLGLL